MDPQTELYLVEEQPTRRFGQVVAAIDCSFVGRVETADSKFVPSGHETSPLHVAYFEKHSVNLKASGTPPAPKEGPRRDRTVALTASRHPRPRMWGVR